MTENRREQKVRIAKAAILMEEYKIETTLRRAFLKAKDDEEMAYENLMNHLRKKIPIIDDAYNQLKEVIENPWQAREVWRQWATTTNL